MYGGPLQSKSWLPYQPCYRRTGLLERLFSWSRQLSLNAETLLKEKSRLEAQGKMNQELRCLFELALQEFPVQPLRVQENATVFIQSTGTFLKFVSGKGKVILTFVVINGLPQLIMTGVALEELPDLQPLSIPDLLRWRNTLEHYGGMTEEMKHCLDRALREFCREPKLVQKNAKMVIQDSGKILEFQSGMGETEISVFFASGESHYHVTSPLLVTVMRTVTRNWIKIVGVLLVVSVLTDSGNVQPLAQEVQKSFRPRNREFVLWCIDMSM